MASPTQTLQLITIPHRPANSDDDNDMNRALTPSFQILQKAKGLQALWRGKSHEEPHTQVALLLWESLAASHAFFTSVQYTEFHRLIQPAVDGRQVEWHTHVVIGTTGLDDMSHLSRILESPAIEVALTKVVEGGVAGYYSQFRNIVGPILDAEAGCDGYFLSPLAENPEDQLLLINWKSVDAHPKNFDESPTLKGCIDALKDYYAVFVVPWHLVELKLVQGKLE